MKRYKKKIDINLFPFLTILLSTMGVLTFIALSLLFSVEDGNGSYPDDTRKIVSDTSKNKDSVLVEFKLIDKPDYIKPHYIICKEDKIYIKDNEIWLSFKEDYSYFLLYNYLKSLENINIEYHKNFKDHQEYVIFGIYPSGIQTYYKARAILQNYTSLNFGSEPMLPNWKIVK